MKKLNFFLSFAMFLVQFAAAQQPKPAAAPMDRPAEPNLLFDDDGGKVQFVPADLSPSPQKTFHGGEVMKSAQQVSIFLGSGWGDPAVRARQAALADIAGSPNSGPAIAEIRSRNVRLLRAAPHIEDFSDFSRTALNDLDIQRKLDQMLKSNALPAPAATTVYVVFLGPGTVSTLGGNKALVDYSAYHSVVHLDAGEIHYVVVPFHADVQKHTAAAARAFSETALNPNGQGWF